MLSHRRRHPASLDSERVTKSIVNIANEGWGESLAVFVRERESISASEESRTFR